MKKKTILALVLTMTMILNLLTSNNVEGSTSLTYLANNYVSFGSYAGQPLVWSCYVSEENVLVLTNARIFTYKALNSATSGTYVQAYSIKATPSALNNGSYEVEGSNLLEWLNSNELNVSYSSQPPTEEAVAANPYADEPGFLYGFTKAEQAAITTYFDKLNTRTHKVLLPQANPYGASGLYVPPTPHAVTEDPLGRATIYDTDYHWNDDTRLREMYPDSYDHANGWKAMVGLYQSAYHSSSKSQEPAIPSGVIASLLVKGSSIEVTGGIGTKNDPYVLVPLDDLDGVDANYTESAEKLAQLKMFQGTGNGFELDRSATRLEGLIMLIRLLGNEEEALAMANEPCPFSDVPDWGKGYANYAYKNGLSKGIGNGLFGTNQALQAKSYMTFLLRALGYNDSEGDFSWADSIDMSYEIGLIDKSLDYQLNYNDFLRDHVAECSYKALDQNTKNSHTKLYEKLVSDKVFEQSVIDKVME